MSSARFLAVRTTDGAIVAEGCMFGDGTAVMVEVSAPRARTVTHRPMQLIQQAANRGWRIWWLDEVSVFDDGLVARCTVCGWQVVQHDGGPSCSTGSHGLTPTVAPWRWRPSEDAEQRDEVRQVEALPIPMNVDELRRAAEAEFPED